MRDIIGELFALLADYARHSRDDQLFERFASGRLPYTFTEYSQYLYEKRRYAEWVEIHSLVGFSVWEIEKDILKEIAASDPEALIPSYHRAAAFLSTKKPRRL